MPWRCRQLARGFLKSTISAGSDPSSLADIAEQSTGSKPLTPKRGAPLMLAHCKGRGVIFGLGAAVHRLVGVRKLQAAGPPWASGSELESADYASSGQNLQVFGRGFNSPRLTSTILTEFIVLTRPLYRLSRKSATP